MAVFLNDTFTDTNGVLLTSHTPETGGTWQRRSGVEATIQSNQVEATASSRNTNTATPGAAEYDIEAHFTATGSSQKFAVIYARYVDASNYYFFRMSQGEGTRKMTIYKKVAGTYTLLDELNEALTVDVEVLFKFEILDATKKAYRDSVEKLSTADNALPAAGSVGLGLQTLAKWNDISVDDTGGAPPSENAFMQPMKVAWQK